MELEVFNNLKEQLQPIVPLITEISELVASLDVMCSFAQHAGRVLITHLKHIFFAFHQPTYNFIA